MNGKDRLNLMVCISTQCLRNLRQIDRICIAEIDSLDCDAHSRRHLAPADTKPPRRKHKNRVAARHHIRQGRLPCRVAIADINCDVTLSAGDRLEVGNERVCQIMQFPLVNIW